MADLIGEATWNLPASMGLIGSLYGIPVIERPAQLRFDEMYISLQENKVVVGELAHFRWRMEQLNLNDDLRKQVRARIEAEGTRILGETWKLSE